MSELSQDNLRRLFPALSDWRSGRGISAEEWVSYSGSMHDALLYSSLFWPDFAEFEGCLLWNDCSTEAFEAWMHTLEGDKAAVEKVLNHRHLTDFFLNSSDEPTDEQVEYFGELLREMWHAKLRRDFPGLPVKVEFYWFDKEAIDDAQITVYLER